MIFKTGLKEFLLPSVRRKFLLRALVVAACAALIFRFIAVPSWIAGKSMEPTYRDGSLVFYLPWLPRLRPPEVGDVVMVRMAGRRMMLMKRIVAKAGDTVEFRQGYLYVNNERQREPYVQYRSQWEMESSTVGPGRVYLVGDNRGMPIDQHDFGQTDKRRIAGYPLW